MKDEINDEFKAINDDVDLDELNKAILTENNLVIAMIVLLAFAFFFFLAVGVVFHTIGSFFNLK
jgi:hypothetical protein